MPPSFSSVRRAELDWIRIAAFGLLIVYHIALFFGPWDWHVNSRNPQRWVASALVASNPWRLGLLFFVSGAAMGLLGRRLSPRRLLIDRTRRLLLPMLFGVIVLVPPQAYVEAITKFGETRDFTAYLRGYFTEDGRPWTGLPLNHLWFIGYIWAYAFAAAAIAPFTAPLTLWIEHRLRGPALLALPALYLVAVRIALFPSFGITNRLSWDWYNHASSLALFLLGYLIVDSEPVWRGLARLRWPALALAAISVVPLMIDATTPPPQHARSIGMMICFGLNQWMAIAALLGFAYRHLRRTDGPVLAYLRGGIFPFYLVHQTAIILIAWRLDPLALPPFIEAVLLTGATIAACIGAYEIARRSGPLAELIGLRYRPRVSASDFAGRPDARTLP